MNIVSNPSHSALNVANFFPSLEIFGWHQIEASQLNVDEGEIGITQIAPKAVDQVEEGILVTVGVVVAALVFTLIPQDPLNLPADCRDTPQHRTIEGRTPLSLERRVPLIHIGPALSAGDQSDVGIAVIDHPLGESGADPDPSDDAGRLGEREFVELFGFSSR